MNEFSHLLLATALIEISSDNNENYSKIRALLDPGSQFNLISSNFAKYLRVKCLCTNYQICSIENLSNSVNLSTSVLIKTKNSSFKLNIKCLVVDTVAESIPMSFFPIENWSFPDHFTIADLTINIPQPVVPLLGAGMFWKILKPQIMKIKNHTSKIFLSQFGWLVAGEILEMKIWEK